MKILGKLLLLVLGIGTGLVAWYTFLETIGVWEEFSKFSLKGQIASPIFGVLEGTSFPTIAASFSIVNEGKESGCIVDLALRFKAKGEKTEWTFFPAYFLKSRMYDYAPERAPVPAIDHAPTPLVLRSYETLTTAVLFLHRPPEGFPRLTTATLKPEEVYELRLYALTSTTGCIIHPTQKYDNIAMDEIKFGDQLNQIKRGASVRIIPLQLDTIRERFVTGESSQ